MRSPQAWLSALTSLSQTDSKVTQIEIGKVPYDDMAGIGSFGATGKTTGSYIDYSRLELGDILIFKHSEDTAAVHIGIYVGTADAYSWTANPLWTNMHFVIDTSLNGPGLMIIEFLADSVDSRSVTSLTAAVFRVRPEGS